MGIVFPEQYITLKVPPAAHELTANLSMCRALTYFRGEPDPFKGDVPNQKVRDMAKEALDAVFAAVDLNAAPSSAPLQVPVCPKGLGGSVASGHVDVTLH